MVFVNRLFVLSLACLCLFASRFTSVGAIGSTRLPAILAEMKAALLDRNNKTGRSLVVLGNSGGDMDSVADALALATFLQNSSFDKFLKHGYSKTVTGKCNATFDGVSHAEVINSYGNVFPVINFPRKMFPLRKDEQFIMSTLSIDESSLIFIDEVEFDDQTRFFLVDHNDIGNASLAKQVDFVVDHHEMTSDNKAGAVDCYVELWGSCSSLIATLIKESTEKEDSNFFKENPEWATLMLAPMHQDWDKEKTLQYDLDIMAQVSQASMWSKHLLNLKRDCTNFTVDQFFEKDEKHGIAGGIKFSMPELQIENMSTFVAGTDAKQTWALKEFAGSISKFLDDNEYDVVFPLKVPDVSPLPGELAVLTYNKRLVRYMSNISHLQPKDGQWYNGQSVDLTDNSSESPFVEIKKASGLWQGYWTFTHGSRKQLLPMVQDMLEAFSSSTNSQPRLV